MEHFFTALGIMLICFGIAKLVYWFLKNRKGK